MKSQRKAFGISGFVGAFVLTGACFIQAPAVRADDCQKRIARADHRLHEAIRHHGVNSPEAERYRHDLAEARGECWEHGHRWWSEDDHRWHTDRDWDDHDHDHR